MIRLAARNWVGDEPNTVWDPVLSARGLGRSPDRIGLGFRVRGEGILTAGSLEESHHLERTAMVSDLVVHALV
jgi:hypothetical protein